MCSTVRSIPVCHDSLALSKYPSLFSALATLENDLQMIEFVFLTSFVCLCMLKELVIVIL